MANTPSPATAASAAAWSSFSVVTAATIIIFWVLFPFYSYQLQIIFDQKSCFDPELKVQHCNLPSKQNGLPYCPDTECKESVEGPDMFTKFFNSFGTILKQIYTIITGVVWIEIDKSVTKMEHNLHNPKPKKNRNADSNAVTPQGPIGQPVADAIKAVANFEDTKSGGGWRWNRFKKAVGDAGTATAKALKNPRKTVYCKDKIGSDKTCFGQETAVKKAIKILESTPSLHINRKNFVNMAFCKIGDTNMSDFYDDDIQEHVKDSKTWCGLYNYPPLSYIFPKKFGWPYTYIFNENGKKQTRYDPECKTGDKSFIKWFGAWFAKTQQRSWSNMRNLWSMILGLFLPFLEDEVTYDDITKKLKDFIEGFNKSTTFMNASKVQDSSGVGYDMMKIRTIFENIEEDFKNKGDDIKNNKTTARVALFQVMKEFIEKPFQEDITEKDHDNEQGNNQDSDNYDKEKHENIYLRFFVAAIRSAKYDGSRWISHSIGLGGNIRYWMRYIITWYIPMLTMVTMGITMFLGFWMTALSSINRYSSIIFPFFFGFAISLYNMFALPTSLFNYFIMGGLGKRPESKNCPYDSGVYQMRRNFWQYLPLNLYLTLGIISMQLGPTLAATGKPKAGIILTFLFPVLFLIVFLYRILSALASLI
jgi:hypothetical protein